MACPGLAGRTDAVQQVCHRYHLHRRERGLWAGRTLAPLDPGTVVMPAVVFTVEAAPPVEEASVAPAMSPVDPAGTESVASASRSPWVRNLIRAASAMQ